MKNFTGQKFGLILKDWTSVIKLKNSNGNASGLVSSGQHLKISLFHMANMLISYLSHTWLILLLYIVVLALQSGPLKSCYLIL
jgi:hypothetical protein